MVSSAVAPTASSQVMLQLLRPEVLRDMAVTVQPAWAGSAAHPVDGETPVIWPEAAGAVEVMAIALSTPSHTAKAAARRASLSGLLGCC